MITPEVVIAYTQCKLKAYLLLYSDNKGIANEYISILEKEKQKNSEDYIISIRDEPVEKSLYSTKKIKRGIPVLFDAKLTYKNLNAHAIVLTRNKELSSKRKHNYIASIVIGTNKVNKETKLYLTFVSYVLSKLQSEKPKSGIIVRSGGKVSKVKINMLYKEVTTTLKYITNWVGEETSEAPEVSLNKHCINCPFMKECETKAIEKDDLSLLRRISQREINRYNKKGIFTITQLSYLFKPRKQRKGKKSNKAPLRYRSELQALAIRTKKTYIQELPKLTEKKTELFLDIEGIPDQDLYYLIGLLVVSDSGEKLFYSFWADSKKNEKEIWSKFITEMDKHPDCPVYHYGSYDSKAINKLKSRYGQDTDLISNKLINVNFFIYSKIYFPIRSNALKEIGHFLGMKWSHAEASGLQSLVWRYYWTEDKNYEYKNILLIYNKEDCKALYLLKTYLSNISTNSESERNIDFADDPKKHSTNTSKLIHNEFEQILQSAHEDYDKKKISTNSKNNTKKGTNKNRKNYARIIPKHNKIIKVPSKRKCLSCASKLSSIDDMAEHVITDLIFTKNGCKKSIIKYTGRFSYCHKCNKKYLPNIIENYHGRPFGHAFISWAIYQRIINRLPYRIIIQTMSDMFNTGVAEATIVGWMAYFAKYYTYTEKILIQNILKSNIIHADETKINIQGEDHFVWVFTDGKHVVFKITENREATIAHEFLVNFDGVLITDFYPGYDSINCRQQKCWVHLIRDINNDLWKEPFNIEFEAFVLELRKLIVPILQTIQKYGEKICHTNKYKKPIEMFYKKNIDNSIYTFDVTIKYQKRLQRYKDSLFTFMTEDGIPWNNNMAERAIRQLAVQRKISGSFYKNAAPNYLLLLAISQTCRFQEKSFLKFLISGEKNVDLFKNPRKPKYSVVWK